MNVSTTPAADGGRMVVIGSSPAEAEFGSLAAP